MGDLGLNWTMALPQCTPLNRGDQAAARRWRLVLWLSGLLCFWGLPSPLAAQSRVLSEASLAWLSQPHDAASAAPTRVKLPHVWAQGEGALPSAGAWQAAYTLTFDDPGAVLPAVYIERACSNLEVKVNGELLDADAGHLAESFAQRCYFPRLWAIPRGLLQDSGNTLQLKLRGYPLHQVAQRPHQGGLSAIEIGEHATLRKSYDARYTANITAPQLSGAVMALLGVFILVLAFIRPKEKYLLFYGLTLLGWAVISTRFYVGSYEFGAYVVPHFPLAIATATLLCLVFYWGTEFFLHFAGLRLAWLRPVSMAQCLAAPLLLVAGGPVRLFSTITLIYSVVVLQFVVVTVWASVKAWTRLRREFLILGPIVGVSTLLILTQIAQQHGWMALPAVHLSHFSMPLTFVAIGIRLVQQFMQALATSEKSNQVLEQRVAEKTRELERNYEQISAMRVNQATLADRQRIASDLHDDLGAKLLTIAQASQPGPAVGTQRTAQLARQALDEMRLSVHGLTAHPVPAAELFADWRGETLQRLEVAGLPARWLQPEPPAHVMLNARLQVQVTRVLREAVSNVIRHSGARRCDIHLSCADGQLLLAVDDDGVGFSGAGTGTTADHSGHGLINIERRAFNLGGSHRYGKSPLGGARVEIVVPLESGDPDGRTG